MHLGVDFGTCFTSAAVLTGNQFRIVRDSSGGNSQLVFPSAAYLTPEGGLLLGAMARNSARKEPARFRDEFKRDLGSDTPYLLGDRQFLPQDLITHLLKHLKEEAESGLNTSISDTVLTIPAAYDTYRRDLMRQAGIDAGFRREGITLLDEPEAAALYYEWQLEQQGLAVKDGAIVLVYDLGGGTFDAALMRKEGVSFRALAPAVGATHCGGIDFDHMIYEEILAAAGPELKVLLEPDNTSVASLRMKQQIGDYCRDVKHQLSTIRQYEDVLPGPGGEDFLLTRTAFEQKIAPYLEGTIALCRELVASANCSWDQVSGLLLIGGSSRIPAVSARLADEFDRPLWRVEDPKQAVCLGAAIVSRPSPATPIPAESRPQELSPAPVQQAAAPAAQEAPTPDWDLVGETMRLGGFFAGEMLFIMDKDAANLPAILRLQPDVTHLALMGKAWGDAHIAALIPLKSLTQLKLEMCEQVTDLALQHIAQIRSLKVLHIQNLYKTDRLTLAGFRRLESLRNLEQLILPMGFMILSGSAHSELVAQIRRALPGVTVQS